MPAQRTPEQWQEDAKKMVLLDGDTARRTAVILEVLEELIAGTTLSPEQVDCLSIGSGDLGPLRAILPSCRRRIVKLLDGDDEGGSAGDREPLTPRPAAPAAAEALLIDHE